MNVNVKWMWSGKMIDCNGRICQFHLGQEGEKEDSTSFLIELVERDGHVSRYSGTASMAMSENAAKISFVGQDEKQQVSIPWEASLATAEAGRYAKSAMYGVYNSSADIGQTFLSRGVMVLWQFE